MPTKVVLGAQWGDEGKAKVVDYLTVDADCVVRYQGGANAGHTVKVGDDVFIFHVIPAGILHPGKTCVIGNGVVLDPEALLQELDELSGRGVSVDGRLFISATAHLVMPYHKVLEKAGEESRGNETLGTTLRGIGPSYRDKVERVHGLRVIDLLDAGPLREKLTGTVRAKNRILTRIYGQEPLDEGAIIDSCLASAERLRPYVTDTSVLLNRMLDDGRTVLFEGAQGTLLDIDHGTYPFVTSSNTTAGGACTGTGIGPTRIDEVIGVTKAYTTRVGNGPFPTELLGREGDRIRELGMEYGATTGRPRRCGWFDATILRRARLVNGLTSLAITRLDILDTVDRLKLCTGYRLEGETVEEFPMDSGALERCTPIYEELPGWCTPTTGARRIEELPEAARGGLRLSGEVSGAPVSRASVGACCDATIAGAGLEGGR
ncbi:MAG: adenylosuccinate synthase [Gemmatimonadetes bacterium]|nr:adenylosuccinate synthase [Gemmatimonadota bacterium]